MTLGQKIAWDDSVLPFQLDNSDIRGRVARLDGVLGGILSQHDYPAPVEALVAEIVAGMMRAHDPAWERGWIAEIDGERVGSVFVVRKNAETAQLRLDIRRRGAATAVADAGEQCRTVANGHRAAAACGGTAA